MFVTTNSKYKKMKLKFKWIFMLLLAMSVQFSFAQEKTISGVVSDATGPIPGVNVIIKGTKRSAQTDFDGKYAIKAKSGETLVFSYLGMNDSSVTIGASNSINVKMTSSSQDLDEVIVVAYGTTTKEAFTGAASVVSAEKLELRALTSPIAAIEGNVTGVQFTSASGQPGSSPGIVIRGVGTLNGSSDPLIILDGVDFQGGLNTINQDDIASLTVLKDAASTSLYGSRAANGVVIITTKKGKKGRGITVNATSQFGVITKGIDEYDAVNPGQYYELMFQAYKNTLTGANAGATAAANIFNRLGRNPFNVPNDQIVDANGVLNPNAKVIAKDLNWYDALERTGTRQNHSINVSGGGDNHTVFLSVSDLEEKGYVIESDYKRTTGRLSGTFKPKEWLSLGGNLSFTDEVSSGPASRGASVANVFSFAKNMGSIYSPYLLDPVTGQYIYDEAGNVRWDRGESISDLGIQSRPTNVGRNAIEEAILNVNSTKRNNIGYRFNADLTIVEGLGLALVYGQDTQSGVTKSYENAFVGDGAGSNGRLDDSRFTRNVENFSQVFSYKKSIANHNFDVILGHESFNRKFNNNRAFKTNQTVTGIYELDNFSVISAASGSSTDYRLEGFFARLNYDLSNKYYLSGSVRRDGSSVFTNNKWGTFYSVGGSWRINKEDFLKDVSFVNDLKLRGSYGEVGNDNLLSNGSRNYYISQPLYGIYPNAGAPGLYWNTTGNADLKWEKSTSWDVALEFGLFNNRVSGSFEFYKKQTSDLLYNVPIPASEGQIEAPNNIGDMYNQGFELGLNLGVIRAKDFSWDLGLQASTLKNEVTNLPSPFVTGSKRWEVGRSRFDYFLYDYAGVDPSNGDALYNMYEEIDGVVGVPVLNEDGTQKTSNSWNTAGKGYVGESSLPDLIGSISNSFKFKNMDLSFLFTYQLGGKTLDYGYADLMHEGDYGAALHPDALNAWKNPGDITDVPRLQNGNTNLSPNLSSRWLTDSDYIALRNVTFSYSLTKAVSDKIGMDKLKFFVSGENMFIAAKRTGLDPQYNIAGTPDGTDYNPNRVISFGVNATF